MGYGKTRKEVVNLQLRRREWRYRRMVGEFCKRWPNIRLCKGDSFPLVQDQMSNHLVFKSCFDLLDKTHVLKDKPSQIYNCDESGIPLEHKLPKIVGPKGMKKVRQCTSGTKTQITILACASAAGQTIPPMVMFTGKTHNNALSKGEVPETLFGMLQLGWMDQELFSKWFSKQFLKYAVIATRWTLFTLHSPVGKIS